MVRNFSFTGIVIGMAFVVEGVAMQAIGGNDLPVFRATASAQVASPRDVEKVPQVMAPQWRGRQDGESVDRETLVKPIVRSSSLVRKKTGSLGTQIFGKTPSVAKRKAPLQGKQARRAHRRSRGHAQRAPQVIVVPKEDLSYHGMLEQPQRYRPQSQHGKGEAPNPNAGTLLHDHFQELDKNRDGTIDPFERAFGRLDIDRDLADRQWQ